MKNFINYLENICYILTVNNIEFKVREEPILSCEEYYEIYTSKLKKKKGENVIGDGYKEFFGNNFIYKWFHKWNNKVFPVKLFIENNILQKPLRDIQITLYNKIKLKLKNKERIYGIVKWATGVGKRIGIILSILLLHEDYIKKNKQCKIVLCSHRNDIFEGKAMKDYNHLKKRYSCYRW